MKKLILIALLAIPCWLLAQEYYIDSISVIVTDNLGNSDSVLLGFEDDATIGIDKFLGEEDISDKLPNDLDIRSIQSSYKNQYGYWFISCTGNAQFVSFDQDIELKTDIRYIWNDPTTATQYFVLKLQAENYPLVIRTKCNKDFDSGELLYRYCLFNDSLNEVFDSREFSVELTDTLVVIPDKSQGSILFIDSEIIVGADQISQQKAFRAFPNPCNDFLTISVSDKSTPVQIYNIHGKLFQTLHLGQTTETLNTSGLPSGVYILKNGSNACRIVKIEKK